MYNLIIRQLVINILFESMQPQISYYNISRVDSYADDISMARLTYVVSNRAILYLIRFYNYLL